MRWVGGGFWRSGIGSFIVLNLVCLVVYVKSPESLAYIYDKQVGFSLPFVRLSYWVLSISLLRTTWNIPNLATLLKRMMLLSGAFIGLVAALSEFYESIEIMHLVAAEKILAMLVQIVSIALFFLEFKARSQQAEKY